MHLSAMPTGKSDLSTHLGITIRWSAPPGSYLPVANRAAKPADGVGGAQGGQSADASRAGDVTC